MKCVCMFPSFRTTKAYFPRAKILSIRACNGAVPEMNTNCVMLSLPMAKRQLYAAEIVNIRVGEFPNASVHLLLIGRC